jgi:hypothetical protein
MSDYTQIVYFAPKDALVTGNPLKKITGTQFDAELAAISTAILSKLDSADIATNGEAAALASTSKLITPANLLYALDAGQFQTAGGLIGNLPTVAPINTDVLMFYDLSTGELANCNVSTLLGLVPAGPVTAVKLSTTSRASTTTKTADPELSVAVAANSTYKFEAFIKAFSTSAAPDFRSIFTGPSGYDYYLIHNGGFGGNYTEGNVGYASEITRSLDANIEGDIYYTGVLTTAGTAGNFTFDWAQLTSDVTATQVRAGSYLTLTKLA